MNDGVFEVLSTSGNTFLGGEDFDERIMNWMADQFLADTGIDLRQDRLALQRLKEVAERAKCDLSTRRKPLSICRSSPPTQPVRSTSTRR